MYRCVLAELSLANAYGEASLAWATEVDDAAVLAALVRQAESEADARVVDLVKYGDVSEMRDKDLITICSARRLSVAFDLTGCVHLSDEGIAILAARCTSLQSLTLDGCASITDASLNAVRTLACKHLGMLSLQRCRNVTSFSVAALMRAAPDLRLVNLNFCDGVDDSVLEVAATACRKIEMLHLAFCSSLSDEGMTTYAMTVNHALVRSLDLSYCSSLSDDALAAVAARLTALEYLSLAGMHRATTRGVSAVAHSCWRLEELVLDDMHLLGDSAFHFDPKGDGRREADDNMLTALKKLSVRDCVRLGDVGVGGLSTRARSLEALQIAGCPRLTDAGAKYLVEEPSLGGARGDGLRVLDLAFCVSLTDGALDAIALGATNVQRLELAGLAHISDTGLANMVRHATQVNVLSVARCKRLTDVTLCSLSDHLWLDEIDLSHNGHFTDDGMEALTMELRGLSKVTASWCVKLTDRSVESIARNLAGIAAVDLRNCKEVTRAGTEVFVRRHPKAVLKWGE